MLPVLFINSRSVPFVSLILSHAKVYETRSRDMLRSLVGQRILIAETGNGKPLVVCSAVIHSSFPVNSFHEWDMFRSWHCVPADSPYEWNSNTKVKYLYELSDIRPVPVPFVPAEGKRHGRVWMEYAGKLK